MQGFTPTDHFETVWLTSANRISGIPSDCIVPVNPTIEIQRDSLEVIFQSFAWIATGASGVINAQYDIIPFEESAGSGPTYAVVAPLNYTTNYSSSVPGYYIGAGVTAALNAASPNGQTYNYSTNLLQQSVVGTSSGTFKFLWNSGATSMSLNPFSFISYAMGYGTPWTGSDTAYGATQTSPSIQNTSGPSGFIINITNPATLPTGVPYTSDQQPGTWSVPVNSSQLLSSFWYNVAPYSGRLKTGLSSNIGRISTLGIKIHIAENYPPYPLNTLNDWKLSFLIRRPN